METVQRVRKRPLRDDLAALHAGGLTQAQIAALYTSYEPVRALLARETLNHGTISRWMKHLGLRLRTRVELAEVR